MYVYFFWLLTIIMALCSLAFVVPVLWLPNTRSILYKQWSCVLTVLSVVGLPLVAYILYLHLGAAQCLGGYYTADAISKRKDMAQIRPVYARLQREAVKADLNLAVDLANL